MATEFIAVTLLLAVFYLQGKAFRELRKILRSEHARLSDLEAETNPLPSANQNLSPTVSPGATSTTVTFSHDAPDPELIKDLAASTPAEFDWHNSLSCHAALQPARQCLAAFDDFDEWMHSQWYSQVLSTTGTVAPLVGVIITSIGFSSGNFSSGNISASIFPLAIGVGGGATLALLNQALTLMISRHQLRFRQLTMPLIQPFCRQNERIKKQELTLANLADSVAKLDLIVDRQGKIAELEANNITNVLLPSQKRVQTAAEKISNAVIEMAPNLSALSDAFLAVEPKTDDVVNSISNLATASNTLSSLLVNDLSRTLRQHNDQVSQLGGTLTSFSSLLEDFQSLMTRIGASSDLQAKATDRVLELFEEKLNPAISQLAETTSAGLSAIRTEGASTQMTNVRCSTDVSPSSLADEDAAGFDQSDQGSKNSLRNEVLTAWTAQLTHLLRAMEDLTSTLGNQNAGPCERPGLPEAILTELREIRRGLDLRPAKKRSWLRF